MIDDSLKSAVMEIIRTGMTGGSAFDEAAFENLAIAIATGQGLVKKSSVQEKKRQRLDLIEPLPETAFKMITVAQFPPSEAEAEFRTSGTADGEHGKLLVRDMSVYRESVLKGFRMFCMYGRTPHRFISLIPSGKDRPYSSLSWMATFLIDEFAQKGVFASRGKYLQGDKILEAIRLSREDGEPIFILGTSLDFLTLFEFLREAGEKTELPAGSRIMHTGGPKTSGHKISRELLRTRAGLLLGVEKPDVIEEFGMTELFSQAYDAPRITSGPRRLVNVPWMKTRLLDPATMKDVPEGQRGILVHYDLANFDTCVAMMAGDTALRIENGFADIKRTARVCRPGCSSAAARKTAP